MISRSQISKFIFKKRTAIIIIVGILYLIALQNQLINFAYDIMGTLDSKNYSQQIPIAQFILSVASLLCLNAAIIYSALQFLSSQKRNRIQDFEKNFYNRINYLDNVVLNEIEFNSQQLNGSLKPVGRPAFLYFNEIFRHYHCHTAFDVGAKYTAEDYDASNDKAKFMLGLSMLYNEYFIQNNGKDIFGFYVKYFVSIVEIIMNEDDINSLQKAFYSDVLTAQLNSEQALMIYFLANNPNTFPALYSIFQNTYYTYSFDISSEKLRIKEGYIVNPSKL